ncbi:MAG: ComF family protein [Helicobacteraceae bacterium]|jgi:competence protein ComFC|nr:ComF family protein [Helicobacteraceae bacterium]
MRCLLCAKWSISLICGECDRLFAPTPKLHTLKHLNLISFYDYDAIETLLWAKYHAFGSFILQRLAKKAFRPFFCDLKLEKEAALIPVDDRPNAFFSHTAILAKYGAGGVTRPYFGCLRAKSTVKYAGKTLSFRKKHPRGFMCKKFPLEDAILVDDLCTTGTTLLEAEDALRRRGKKTLFAVTLAKAM